jgi:hypothetical protein
MTEIEINRREGDGLAVALYWLSPDKMVKVVVYDADTGDPLEESDPLPGEWATDAFDHPHVYTNILEPVAA